MSLIITQDGSGTLLSAGNDNISCISGDTLGAPNVFEYKYIADIYVNGVLQVTLKSFPDPLYGVGVFNTKNIINSFLGNDYLGFSSSAFNQCPNSSCRVYIQYGEEYVSGTTFVQNRDVTDAGTSIYINSAIATALNIDNGGIAGLYYPQGNNVNFLDGKNQEPIISFGTGLIFPAFSGQPRFLYFVNNTRTGDDSNTGVLMTIFTFDENGDNIGEYQLLSPYDHSSATDVQAIGVGMDILSSSGYTPISGPDTMFGNGEVSYTIYLNGQGDGNCAWTFSQFNITDDCGRFANQAYYIDWLNDQGGYSSWLFNKKNETTQTKQVQKYKKIPGTLTNEGEFFFLPWDRSQQTYYTVLQDQIVMFSDFLSDSDVLYLKSLVSSPSVYARRLDGLLTAVTVEDNSYRINKRVNQKIYSLQLTINQSYNDYRQQL